MWFPEHHGLVVGLIVGGFGLGAVVFTPIQTALINPNNLPVNNITRQFTNPEVLDRVPVAFLILGGIVSAIHVVGFCLLRAKPIQSVSLEVNVPPKQLLRHIDFYLLWFVMFCDIIPITIITSVYKLFGQQLINDDQFLSIVATLSSVFNAGGRVAWGGTVDRLSFKASKDVIFSSNKQSVTDYCSLILYKNRKIYKGESIVHSHILMLAHQRLCKLPISKAFVNVISSKITKKQVSFHY
ncbi:unnamed protein product [Trichobilharzia regenti]|nr:unnamed protein product [Trichobilharzia regenti]